MASEFVGFARCPLCSSPKAKVTLTKVRLTCLTCGACSCQVFARSERSDEKVRGLLVEQPAGDPAPKEKEKEKETVPAGDSWDPFG